MSILEDLYNGKIYPFESIVPQDKAYRTTNREISEMREYFAAKLLPEDKEKFKRLNDLIHQSTYMESYENFTCGFRLGVLFMCDVLAGYEQLTTE